MLNELLNYYFLKIIIKTENFYRQKLFLIINLIKLLILYWGLGIGDWGLGIGDWAQSPIPNPQSPIPNFLKINFSLF